tara:strand:+ start:494 stop:1702 length:1209 start_codon:yes stop_codon:yes gene_type:complete
MSFPNVNEQLDLITTNIDELLPADELEKKIIKSRKNNIPLNIKLGCDPSRPDLHIGHSVVLNKLKNFQELGHNVILVIGDFTAMIGDPTGRNKTRPQIDLKETKENSKTYIDQVSKIINIDKTRIVYNSKWLNDINLSKVISLSSKFTLSQFLERDDFSKRYKNGKPISLHEFMYPLAQAYDSVYLRSDVEIGGTDQKFNLLLARDLQKEYDIDPQIALTMPLIEGTDGIHKMSKSYDNFIAFNDNPNDMYGKVLSIPDVLIIKYFNLVTNLNYKEIKDYEFMLDAGKISHRDLKRKLGREIVSLYYDNKLASSAEQHFDNIFVNKGIPDNIPEINISENIKIVDLIKKSNLVNSNSEVRRLIKQGAVKVDDVTISNIHHEIISKGKYIIKIGKRKFLKVNS